MKIYHFIHKPTGIVLGDVRVTTSGLTSLYAERTLTEEERDKLSDYVALDLYAVLQEDIKEILQKDTNFFDLTKFYINDFCFEEVL